MVVAGDCFPFASAPIYIGPDVERRTLTFKIRLLAIPNVARLKFTKTGGLLLRQQFPCTAKPRLSLRGQLWLSVPIFRQFFGQYRDLIGKRFQLSDTLL
jgi:hypothetical protein